jgi:hypothetical protein
LPSPSIADAPLDFRRYAVIFCRFDHFFAHSLLPLIRQIFAMMPPFRLRAAFRCRFFAAVAAAEPLFRFLRFRFELSRPPLMSRY